MLSVVKMLMLAGIRTLVMSVALLCGGILLSSAAEAASIQKCSAKTQQCTIKLDKGIVGDTVKVLDDRAHIVAEGWIIKREGAFAVIGFKRIIRDIRKGYPVIVEQNTKPASQWVDASL